MLQESSANFEKEIAETLKLIAENAKALAETRRSLRDGGDRLGEVVEHLVTPNVKEKPHAVSIDGQWITPGAGEEGNGVGGTSVPLPIPASDML
jgi:hypothetical protein